MLTRPAPHLRPAPAASQRPVPAPRYIINRARPQITRHQRRFTRFTRPAIPLACGPRMERAPLGFSPELRTPPTKSRRRTSGWGRALSTSPGLRSRHQPNLQSAHPLVNVRPRVAPRSLDYGSPSWFGGGAVGGGCCTPPVGSRALVVAQSGWLVRFWLFVAGP
jgi:hypothetical protein